MKDSDTVVNLSSSKNIEKSSDERDQSVLQEVVVDKTKDEHDDVKDKGTSVKMSSSNNIERSSDEQDNSKSGDHLDKMEKIGGIVKGDEEYERMPIHYYLYTFCALYKQGQFTQATWEVIDVVDPDDNWLQPTGALHHRNLLVNKMTPMDAPTYPYPMQGANVALERFGGLQNQRLDSLQQVVNQGTDALGLKQNGSMGMMVVVIILSIVQVILNKV